MDRRTAFFTEFAALLERHGVTLTVRETGKNYSTYVEGIDVEFDYRVDEEYPCGKDLQLPAYVDAEAVQKRIS